MRAALAVCVLLSIAGAIDTGSTAAAKTNKPFRLAQSSTTTACMMTCNSTAATCQAACVVPGSPPSGAATTGSNATASTSCLMNCSTQQLNCQTNCARVSPSQ